MNIPTLRFKPFGSAWKKKILGDVVSYTKGFAFKSKDYKSTGIRIIRVSDLSASSVKYDNQMIFIDPADAKKYHSYKINCEDILITTVGSKPELIDSAVGRGILIKKNSEGLLNQNLLKFNLGDNLKSSFLFSQINSERYISHIKNIQRGNANQSNITVKDLLDFEIYITEIDEQTKIANFLTAVDEKITQLTQKCDLLAQYKKGVMQKIFSQELRFKDDDGQDFPEWENSKLGNIFIYRNGKSFENEISNNGNYFLITLNSIDIFGKLKSEHKKVKSTDYSLEKNDLVMILSDVAHGNFLGLTDVIPSNNYVLNQRIGGLRAKGNINVYFVAFFINHNQKYFKLHGQGSSQQNLSKGDVLNFPLPKINIKEQTKIANFLTAIDEKIVHTQTQLKAVKQYKQGLLQQMFV